MSTALPLRPRVFPVWRQEHRFNFLNQDLEIGLGKRELRCWDTMVLDIGWNVFVMRMGAL